ncbi:HIT family protein [Roseibium sp. M-1]
MADCVFCRIVSGQIPAHVVHEDDLVLVIMDIGHVNPGHTLVLSKIHVETLMDADEDLAAHMFRIANRLAKAVEKAFQCDGVTVLQANRPAGFQTVPHLHLHVLPRLANDGVGLVWPAKNPSQELLARYAASLKGLLD